MLLPDFVYIVNLHHVRKKKKFYVDLPALRMILGNIFTAHAQNCLLVLHLPSLFLKSFEILTAD